MSFARVNPTRMELARLKKQLSIAKRGYKLLKDKQDEMVRQFMLIIRETRTLRIEVEDQLQKIIVRFTKAKLKTNRETILEALMVPAKALKIDVSSKTVMNIKLPTVSFKDEGKIDLTYGFAFTPGDLDKAVLELSELLPEMIKLSQLEKQSDMLAKEIEKTRRRVNAIEFVMIPEMTESIKYIIMKLEDNERSNIIRLMKSKEIILAKTNSLSD
ncbi:MAG: V-type ATP synthase subunit D [Bacilli bacterium]|nr:V-type ATP synthase subunit D [Bacilli bacterium]MDD4076661.1 V-type ATP synthase subunit D [Bacilli bacterium]